MIGTSLQRTPKYPSAESLISSTPAYRARIIDFTPNSRRVEIILQVLNLHHRNAGLWEVISIGQPEDLRAVQSNRMSFDLILFGAIVMVALFNLITWLTRTKNRSGLLLGLFLFVLLQSIQVPRQSFRGFQTVESQSSELIKTNLELHIQEKLHRAAEGESKALHQQLTQSE